MRKKFDFTAEMKEAQATINDPKKFFGGRKTVAGKERTRDCQSE